MRDRYREKYKELIDRYVGRRMYLRRRQLGFSQSDLGKALGVSFQQVQEYELGKTRISASTLYAASEALGVRPSFFFDGLPDPMHPQPGIIYLSVPMLNDMPNRHERALLTLFAKIAPLRSRRAIISLVRALAENLKNPPAVRRRLT